MTISTSPTKRRPQSTSTSPQKTRPNTDTERALPTPGMPGDAASPHKSLPNTRRLSAASSLRRQHRPDAGSSNNRSRPTLPFGDPHSHNHPVSSSTPATAVLGLSSTSSAHQQQQPLSSSTPSLGDTSPSKKPSSSPSKPPPTGFWNSLLQFEFTYESGKRNGAGSGSGGNGNGNGNSNRGGNGSGNNAKANYDVK